MTNPNDAGYTAEKRLWVFDELLVGEPVVEFRLVYGGHLHSNGNVKEKHAIRRKIHRQLKTLWETREPLRTWRNVKQFWQPVGQEMGNPFEEMTRLERLTKNFTRFEPPYHFAPLITRGLGLACRLDVLFLRREGPGDLGGGGDIDNRMKTLFDALRLPAKADEVDGAPAADENPFFVLLEDDRLVSQLGIITDWLLEPAPFESTSNPDYPTKQYPEKVQLVITVQTQAIDLLTYPSS